MKARNFFSLCSFLIKRATIEKGNEILLHIIMYNHIILYELFCVSRIIKLCINYYIVDDIVCPVLALLYLKVHFSFIPVLICAHSCTLTKLKERRENDPEIIGDYYYGTSQVGTLSATWPAPAFMCIIILLSIYTLYYSLGIFMGFAQQNILSLFTKNVFLWESFSLVTSSLALPTWKNPKLWQLTTREKEVLTAQQTRTVCWMGSLFYLGMAKNMNKRFKLVSYPRTIKMSCFCSCMLEILFGKL